MNKGGGGNKRPQFRSAPGEGRGDGGSGGGRSNYGQQQRCERQSSEQTKQGSSSGGYHPQGGKGSYGVQQQQNPGQRRAGGGSYGGKGGDVAPVLFLSLPDPYLQQKDLGKLKQEAVWKTSFSEQKKDVVLHERPREPAHWNVKTIPVQVNHFLVEGIPNRIYQYHITCELLRVQVENQQQQARKVPKDLVEAILKWLIPVLRIKFGATVAIASNFSSNLYVTKNLEELKLPLVHCFTVRELKNAQVIEEDNADEQDESRYVISFQFASDGGTGGVIDTGAISNYFHQHGTLQGFNFSPELKQTLEAALNAILKSVPNFGFYSVGRSTIIPHNGKPASLGEGLVAWKGINMSIGMGWKPYMNLEVANTAMIMGAPVFQVLKDLLKPRRGPDPDVEDMGFLRCHLDKVKAFLKSTKVQYVVEGRRFTFTVSNVFNFGAKDDRTKFYFNGAQVTVYEYYRQRYGKSLAYPNGLLLMKSNGAKIPAELCIMKNGQSVNRKLTGSQTDKMLEVAKREPADHHSDTLQKVKQLGLINSSVLSGFGMKIPDGGMLQIENARVLVPPSVRYGLMKKKDGGVAHISPTNGTWAVWQQDFNFYSTPQKVEKWGVLVVGCSEELESPENHTYLENFLKLMRDQGAKKGIELGGNIYQEFDYNCSNSRDADINRSDLAKTLKLFKDESYRFVLVVLPGKNDALYGHVKHAAEIDVGILTQCVQLKSVIGTPRRPGPSPSLVQNVLLKLNMKLGGINHVTVAPLDERLALQFCTLLMDCPVLVIGADVTHPPPGSKKFFVTEDDEGYSPSYAAVTGSLNKTCMPYMTEVRAQMKAGAGAAEVIQDLEEIVKKMIRRFYEACGGTTLPLKIIYYRDGVGDGQFKEVLHTEMWAIRRACQSIPKNVVNKIMGRSVYEPKITFVTVQKRHKTRMYWDVLDTIKNVPAGTVVDTEIVNSKEISFYLVSHYGALGTSRPTRYHVLWDDSDFSLDEIQSFTFTLCHMFARCTKSVKMPAPTYYAHLAADRAKKLCEGFENKLGDPSIQNLNQILTREPGFSIRHPMHFI